MQKALTNSAFVSPVFPSIVDFSCSVFFFFITLLSLWTQKRAGNVKHKKFTHLAALARMNAIMEAGCFVAAYSTQHIRAIEFWNREENTKLLLKCSLKDDHAKLFTFPPIRFYWPSFHFHFSFSFTFCSFPPSRLVNGARPSPLTIVASAQLAIALNAPAKQNQKWNKSLKKEIKYKDSK